MPQKIRYLLASIACGASYFLTIVLPYEYGFYGLLLSIFVVSIGIWMGLGTKIKMELRDRLLFLLLPMMFALGSSVFSMLIPFSTVLSLVFTAVYILTFYIIFTILNIFWVAMELKTVPIFRAAVTVGWVIWLFTAFLLFDSVLSYRFIYWMQALWVGLLSVLLFLYNQWVLNLELELKWHNWGQNVFLPAWLMLQLALILSFWPTGVFLGSIYLVTGVYMIGLVVGTGNRGKLYDQLVSGLRWIVLAGIFALIYLTAWK